MKRERKKRLCAVRREGELRGDGCGPRTCGDAGPARGRSSRQRFIAFLRVLSGMTMEDASGGVSERRVLDGFGDAF